MHFENEIEHKILVTYVIAKVSGLQEIDSKFYRLTDTGKKAGALIKKGRYGYFIVWPDSLTLEMVEAAGNNQKDLLDRFISWLIS